MFLQAHIAYTEYFISCLHYQTYLGFSPQKRLGVCPSICRKKLVYSPGGGGGHFFWFKILNFNIFGGFQKKKFGGGGDIFWGSLQNWTILSGDCYVF